MNATFQPPAAGPFWMIPAALLLLAGLFPPETRPDSAIGCAVLVALGAAVLWIPRLDGARALTLSLLSASAMLYLLFSDHPGALLVFWATAASALAAGWVMFCLPKDRRRGVWLATVLAVSGGAASLYAIYQRLWGLDALAELIRQGAPIPDAELVLVRAEVGRSFAAFPTPAALGGYLVLIVPVLLGRAFLERGQRRALWTALAALALIGLACSESVTAVLAAIGALGLAALVGRISRRTAAFCLLGALLIAVVVFAARGREVLDVGGTDTPWSLRAKNFRIALEMIEEHPWTGVGPGAFGEHYPAYRRPGDNESQYAHNLPLQMAAELGLPLGIAVALAFFVTFCGPLCLRKAERTAESRAVEVGLAAFALQNLADFTAYLPSVLLTAAILRAAVARRDALAWSWPTRLPALAALVITLAASWVTLQTARADNEAWQARLAMAAGDRPDALRRTERAALQAPWQADLWIGLAQLRAATDTDEDRAAALEAAERALRLTPHRAAAFDLRGRLRFSRGDYPGAYADALEATRLYPMYGPYAARLTEVERWINTRTTP